ncbi:hypothetical protein [Paenibacillus odorifer]|uniref:hypothetical protein n=1 Tax=Paenibacillus odorifer TaxID=189426 RepID=UPI0015C3CE53|nr:hypothetical protein [Paenibacillus odorifer]
MKTDDKEQFVIIGSCADPSCGRFILSGQTVVRHGRALCCNYACLTHYMFSGARRG